MQAIKDKLNDMSAMRKAKAEAREEEKAEKEMAKARVEVAHEVRLAREAEAAMDLHVNKAADKAVEHERKYVPHHGSGEENIYTQESYAAGWNPSSPRAGYSNSPDANNTYAYDTTTAAGMDGYARNRTGGPPTNNNLL